MKVQYVQVRFLKVHVQVMNVELITFEPPNQVSRTVCVHNDIYT